MTIHYLGPEDSALFRPLTIANGNITLRHRIIHAPLTRNRGVPENPISTAENPNRIWIPGDLVINYYSQRASEGGLIISEGIPPSLEVNNAKVVYGVYLAQVPPHTTPLIVSAKGVKTPLFSVPVSKLLV
jgi:2,4-dienoyl-CoA reductase-like NADH-dependent reductase (Old Yellow Enzyme family)